MAPAPATSSAILWSASSPPTPGHRPSGPSSPARSMAPLRSCRIRPRSALLRSLARVYGGVPAPSSGCLLPLSATSLRCVLRPGLGLVPRLFRRYGPSSSSGWPFFAGGGRSGSSLPRSVCGGSGACATVRAVPSGGGSCGHVSPSCGGCSSQHFHVRVSDSGKLLWDCSVSGQVKALRRCW